MNAQLLIPAGGFGSRLGKGIPKALVPIGNKPILYWTLKRLLNLHWIAPPIIAVPPNCINTFEKEIIQKYNLPPCTFVEGGHERQHSVYNGLQYLHKKTDIVVIHDCARPFVPLNCVTDSIEKAIKFGSATVAIPVTNTILEIDEQLFLKNTPNRKYLYECQTPQSFKKEIIQSAHEQAKQKGIIYTDDATLVHEMGYNVSIVIGDPINIKITLPFDIRLSEYLIKIIQND
ncbi:MAG TPA: 2-C-methyl-D-erythritol 4-phosphate cytidylyltransferase [Candidatus Hydrogenedens sp.]|nr:2-C-methyl-D-erythritol 4-phosphate cytidylyltransferase [Candidatus Hydrogenedens sp.]HOK08840.1 2-C-methyl-D-erythritol 4-phosphate cytidylyltransferase [Candidatus Hydrogenedens sp.]HOL18674.1 2-C-methyl-D-erythritol 4-phosphate cytidylyltransferase [Candidatus Hydrogenedens sp.]HPP58529.1 2-C-methyl-D-erythritol 4-phosphate cytidylyltransferase [Candidatus Hydrogenedens sp.]